VYTFLSDLIIELLRNFFPGEVTDSICRTRVFGEEDKIVTFTSSCDRESSTFCDVFCELLVDESAGAERTLSDCLVLDSMDEK